MPPVPPAAVSLPPPRVANRFYRNPMVGEDADDQVVLHFYDFAAKEAHYCCLFRATDRAAVPAAAATASAAAGEA